ncbi:MAG: hypothetical protein H0W33_03170 [Gammaproteobacteria bacterium]|nr:hypothetical protein [Gammaproteobacteria bacterium]
MSVERSYARSGRSYPLQEQIEHGPSWTDHELWQRPGEPTPVKTAVTVACEVAVIESAPTIAKAATRAIAAHEPAAPRLRRRRGRSLFSTFDTARRRCKGGSVVRVGGF